MKAIVSIIIKLSYIANAEDYHVIDQIRDEPNFNLKVVSEDEFKDSIEYEVDNANLWDLMNAGDSNVSDLKIEIIKDKNKELR